MRTFLTLAGFALIASAANTASAQDQYSHEPNTYRFGTPYQIVGASSHTSCAALCGQDQVCKSWSFQRATSLGPSQCELKSSIGRAEANPLMISGINPRIASEGQALQRRIPSINTLLGAPTAQAPINTVVRNRTASSLPATPRPFTPRLQAPPAPRGLIRATPVPTPPQNVRTFTPPPAPQIQQALPARPIAAPATRPALRPAPVAAPTPAPVPVPQRAFVPVPLPAPVSVPVTVASPPSAPQSAPQSAPPSARINVPVAQADIPTGAILRDAPPPQVSFTPLSNTPAPSQTRQALPPPPAQASRAATPAGTTISVGNPQSSETGTYPRRTQTQRAAPKPINTVPAGTVAPPAVTPETPYNRFRAQERPAFSVNNSGALTPDELAAEQAALEAAEKAAQQKAPVILDKVNVGSSDLASERGAPVGPLRNPQQTTRTGGGS